MLGFRQKLNIDGWFVRAVLWDITKVLWALLPPILAVMLSVSAAERQRAWFLVGKHKGAHAKAVSEHEAIVAECVRRGHMVVADNGQFDGHEWGPYPEGATILSPGWLIQGPDGLPVFIVPAGKAPPAPPVIET